MRSVRSEINMAKSPICVDLFPEALKIHNESLERIRKSTKRKGYKLGFQNMLPPVCVGHVQINRKDLEWFQNSFGAEIINDEYVPAKLNKKFPKKTFDIFRDFSKEINKILEQGGVSNKLIEFRGHALNVGSAECTWKETNPFNPHYDTDIPTRPYSVIGLGYPGNKLRNHTVFYEPKPKDSISYKRRAGFVTNIDPEPRTILQEDSLGRFLFPSIYREFALLPLVANPGTVLHHSKAGIHSDENGIPYESTPSSWFLGIVYRYY